MEDLSQDTFIKIYTSLKAGKYNEQGKFLPWALRITRNLCMDHLRRGVKHPVSGTLLHDNYVGTSTQQNAESSLALRQREEQMNAFINNLQEDQKKVIFYRYFEELSFKEIAILMNTSINTSVGRMRYGLMHLRRQVDGTPSYFWR
jgi:RNA polymerase sigma factor (sigma-70 family)